RIGRLPIRGHKRTINGSLVRPRALLFEGILYFAMKRAAHSPTKRVVQRRGLRSLVKVQKSQLRLGVWRGCTLGGLVKASHATTPEARDVYKGAGGQQDSRGRRCPFHRIRLRLLLRDLQSNEPGKRIYHCIPPRRWRHPGAAECRELPAQD